MKSPRELLADVTMFSKYAQYLPDQQRRETYEEAVTRMFAMHERRFAGQHYVLDQIAFAKTMMLERRILGSQRMLQYGGHAIESKNMRGYNCSFSYIDRPRVFAEAFWLLLCGCGVGFSVQEHHVGKLPTLKGVGAGEVTHVIEDSIEGWANAANALIENYIQGGPRVEFNYSMIRPEGAPIKSTTGRAPGPKPLAKALEAVRGVLDKAQHRKLRPIEAYDILMHLAMAVKSGGVRRSATIALFSPTDLEMASAKTGNWFTDNPQRQGSNNSALLVRDETSFATFNALMQHTKAYGEPGVLWVSDKEHGTNPCAEIGLYPQTPAGESGWAMCNLSTVNLAKVRSVAEFEDACVAASILGTIQAHYMDTGYLGAVTRKILERDALLGVSMTGLADNPDIANNHQALRRGAEMAVQTNVRLALALGIKSAARVTTVKPEGTGSLLVQAASGVTPHKDRRYIRNVQFGANEPQVKLIQQVIPEAVEDSVWRQGDVVVSFPIDLGEQDATFSADCTALQELQRVVDIQKHWVQPGTTRGQLNHNVSNTIQVRDHEWEDVIQFIYQNRYSLAGVSLLAASGDLAYPQAPFQATTGEGDRSEIVSRFNRLVSAWKPVDLTRITESDGKDVDLQGTVACAGGACEI
jgi:ribonucleoside-diphosphate reductase alpha chain